MGPRIAKCYTSVRCSARVPGILLVVLLVVCAPCAIGQTLEGVSRKGAGRSPFEHAEGQRFGDQKGFSLIQKIGLSSSCRGLGLRAL